MSGLNEPDLASGRKKVLVSNLQEVEQIQTPRLDPSIFHTDRLDSEMQEVSGVTKATQGLTDSESKYQTATGMSILSEEGNEVIADIIRALNESFFEPAIRRIVKLIYKYDDSPNMYGVDRSKNMKFFVSINAGVGAVNTEVLTNNLSAALGGAVQLVQLHSELEDFKGAKRYLKVLDGIYEEQLKAFKLKTLIPILKGEYEDDETEDDRGLGEVEPDGADAGGGGLDPTGNAQGLAGGAEQQGIPDLPNGIDGQIQQPF